MSKFQIGEYVEWRDGSVGAVCRIDNEKDEVDVRYTDGTERRFTAGSLTKIPRGEAKTWLFGTLYGMSPEKLKKIGTQTGRLPCAHPNQSVGPHVWEDLVKAQELAMEKVRIPAHLIPGSMAVPEKPKWGEPFVQKEISPPKTREKANANGDIFPKVDYSDLELRVLAAILNRGIEPAVFLDHIGLMRPHCAVSETSLEAMREVAKKFTRRMMPVNAPIQGAAADMVLHGTVDKNWNMASDIPINEDWTVTEAINPIHDEIEVTMIKSRDDGQYTEIKDLLARQMGFDPVTVTHEQLVAELKGETEERAAINNKLFLRNCQLSTEVEKLKQKLMIHGDNAQTWWDQFRKPK